MRMASGFLKESGSDVEGARVMFRPRGRSFLPGSTAWACAVICRESCGRPCRGDVLSLGKLSVVRAGERRLGESMPCGKHRDWPDELWKVLCRESAGLFSNPACARLRCPRRFGPTAVLLAPARVTRVRMSLAPPPQTPSRRPERTPPSSRAGILRCGIVVSSDLREKSPTSFDDSAARPGRTGPAGGLAFAWRTRTPWPDAEIHPSPSAPSGCWPIACARSEESCSERAA